MWVARIPGSTKWVILCGWVLRASLSKAVLWAPVPKSVSWNMAPCVEKTTIKLFVKINWNIFQTARFFPIQPLSKPTFIEFICGIDGCSDDDNDGDIHGAGCSQRFCLPTAGNIDPWLTKAAQAGKLHIGCHGTTCDQFWEWKMFWLNVFWGINGVKIWDITHWKQSLCRKESGGA